MRKRSVLKVVAAVAGLPLLALLLLAAYTGVRWDRVFDAPYPDIQATSDPAVVEQGRYLAFGPAHCGACHAAPDRLAEVEAGAEVPLVGGMEWRLPLGVVRTPNITPDPETGIGRYTDQELARVLRHGVKPNGRVLLPFMEFQDLSDADLAAIISYLRSIPGVRNEVRPTELTLIGRGVLATVIRPIGPSGTPPAEAPPPADRLARGAYLVNSVANCAGCHSERNMVDGSYEGPRLAGGSPMPLDEDPSIVLVPPNLTPDPETGHIRDWTQEQFIARFRAGSIQRGSHMPWTMFARMSDADLEAIYLYLRAVEPVRKDTGPVRRSAD